MEMRNELRLEMLEAENTRLKTKCESYSDTAHQATREVARLKEELSVRSVLTPETADALIRKGARLREVNQKLLEALKTMRGSWVVRPDDKINQMIYRLANEAIALAKDGE